MTYLSPVQVCDEPRIFPRELSDIVVEYLHDDLVSLKQCSFVSRAWLYSSRIHLFRHLCLTPVKMASFIKFTKYSPQTISPHVKHLELAGFDWYSASICPQRALLPQFASTLTHLHLRDSIFCTFLDVLDAICTFPCLQALSLENIRWGKNDSPGPTPAPSTKSISRSLTHLRLWNTDSRQFISWVLAHKEIPMVSSVDIGPIEEHHAIPFSKYLCILGSSLKHLRCTFNPGQIGHLSILTADDFSIPVADYQKSIVAHFKGIFGIESCYCIRALMNLRSVHIDNFISLDGVDEGASSFWAPRLLVSLQSLDLQRVVLEVSLSRVGDLDQRDIKWHFLDEVFTSASYANVTSVTFSVSGRVNLDGLAGFMYSRLPRCAERGLLQFVKEAPVKGGTFWI